MSHLFLHGSNIFFKQSEKKHIVIPVEDAPTIDLVFIYKNNKIFVIVIIKEKNV